MNFTIFENTTSTIPINQTTPFNSTESSTWTVSNNQTDYFNITQNYTSFSTTMSTASPATSVSLNNLVILTSLNENKTSRAIIDPDETFSEIKSQV